jgi:hypothetical protein
LVDEVEAGLPRQASSVPTQSSHLWETESWPDLDAVPTGAEVLQACPKIDQALEEIAASLAESVRTQL